MASRRRFLGQTLGLAAAGATPRLVRAAPFELATLHHDTVREARRLDAGRGQSLTVLVPEGSEANVAPAANWFTSQSGIPVDVVVAPFDDINTRVMIDSLSGDRTYDIALPATFGVHDLADAGALLPLDELTRRFAPANLNDGALYSTGSVFDGKRYGYQTDGDTYLMFYQREWLEDVDAQRQFSALHGEPLQIARTWEELDRQLAFFHKPDEGRYGGALFRTPGYIAWEWWSRFHAQGYWPFDDDLEPQISNDAGVRALEALTGASAYLSLNARTNGLFENWSSFGQGNTFCNIGWGGTQKFLNQDDSALKGKLAFGSLPGGEFDGKHVAMPYFNWGWDYVVPSGTPHPELAFLFILTAVSPSVSTQAVAQVDGYFDPFRVEHYADSRIRAAYGEPFLKVHRASLSNSFPDLYLPGQADYFDSLRTQLVRADRGEVPAAEALEVAAREWRRISRRMGRDTQRKRWRQLKARYPETLRNVMR
jgi:multiple sugar transport system substrate-binding protein